MTPGCEWVIAGEGVPTIKWDGTCCAIIDGKFYKRFDAKKCKEAPEGFIEAQSRDEHHWLGWVPVGDEPISKYHREGYDKTTVNGEYPLSDGTYELVGPMVQGGAERRFRFHWLVKHGALSLTIVLNPTFHGIQRYLQEREIEGIVYHHPDGRFAKVKRKDFGLEWPIKNKESNG